MQQESKRLIPPISDAGANQTSAFYCEGAGNTGKEHKGALIAAEIVGSLGHYRISNSIASLLWGRFLIDIACEYDDR